MAIFNQDFRTPGSETIASFNPQQDVIDFTSVNAGGVLKISNGVQLTLQELSMMAR